MKTVVLTSVLVFTAMTASAALAQDRGARDDASDGGAGARTGHITATGETVPNPGASQGAGTTSMDRGIQSQDNKIDTSICKGC